MRIKILLLVVALILAATNLYAADYYIAQTAAGSGDGSACANADALADLTWGTGNMVEAGDTLHLCGTLTSTLTIGASGTSGSPITIQFESGSKFSKAYWGTTTSAAIYANGRSYITIDGNSTGIIENTANGDGLANQQESNGIDVTGGSNWIVKDLTIQNLYVHTYGTNSSTRARGARFTDTSSVSVYGNTIHDCYYGVNAGTSGSAVTNINIYSNTISACSTAVVTALGNAGTSLDGVNIYNNTLTMGLNWWAASGENHIDGIHVWGVSGSTSPVSNLKIYNNIIDGDPSTSSTAPIYIEYNVLGPQIYNNVINTVTNHPSRLIYIKGISAVTASNAKIYNNTMVGNGNGVAVDIANATGVDLKNNIISNTDYILTVSANSSATSNYNDYYPTGDQSKPFSVGGTTRTWAQWQALGYDTNSISIDPEFVSSSDFSLQSTSDAINAGTDLSSYFTTDILGATRPTGSFTWDMGAYEYGGTGGDTTPPTVEYVTILENGISLVIGFSEPITATDNAAFTLDPTGADVTVDCPVVETATDTMTCTISRAILYSETATYGYTGGNVADVAENALEEITNAPLVVNYSVIGLPSTATHAGGIFGGCSLF